MAGEKQGFYTNFLKGIEKGLARVELDRGGHWSEENHIWVDRRFSEFVNGPLLSPEAKYIEILGAIGLSVGRLFNRQIHDSNNGVMWPKEVLGENGAEKLLAAAEKNPSILNPFSLISDGLEKPTVPYSVAYKEELAKLNRQLDLALKLEDSPSAKAHVQYLKALINAYTYERIRSDDTEFMEAADRAWVNIDPDANILIFAEPTEVYHDPVRVALGQDQKVAQLAKEVEEKNGLGIWRPFFEFRLLVKDESMVKKDEIDAIRHTSRKLFATESDPEVPVSLEFRRLLLASGNGAHPAKTAKNYPNFEQIRSTDGYKNVLYTNMIEEGTLTQVIPALRNAFGGKILNQFDEQQLIRGASLYVLAHEENHPYKRFSDGPLEELKSSVNGIKTLMESNQFNEQDINSALIAEIGYALHGREQMMKARREGDVNKQRGLEAYYKSDTILLNFFVKNGGFLFEGPKIIGIDFKALRKSINIFVNYLGEAQAQSQVTAAQKIYAELNNENVWNMFTIASP